MVYLYGYIFNLVYLGLLLQIAARAWTCGRLLKTSFDPTDPTQRTIKRIIKFHLLEGWLFAGLAISVTVFSNLVALNPSLFSPTFTRFSLIFSASPVIPLIPLLLLWTQSPAPSSMWPAAWQPLLHTLRSTTVKRIILLLISAALTGLMQPISLLLQSLNIPLNWVLLYPFIGSMLVLVSILLLTHKFGVLRTSLHSFSDDYPHALGSYRQA